MSKRKQLTYVEVHGQKIPVNVIKENRTSIRYAIGKYAVIMRLPRLMTKQSFLKHLGNVQKWLEEQVNKNPDLLTHLAGRVYYDGMQLQVGGHLYTIFIQKEDRKTIGSQLEGQQITLKIPTTLPQEQESKHFKRILSKTIGSHQLPEITARVNHINNVHFNYEIKNVRLKYNSSNWGSCNRDGVVSLSTRLLFAPQEVIDYVIIHELAHIKVFNHSSNFWELVENRMPDYKEKEKWLKENYFKCDF
ncbi:MAG: M48 family metallopeptidase [Bacteroidota bacterium]